jgi:DNA-directed RNA polymerase subunit RPC12/RpoP
MTFWLELKVFNSAYLNGMKQILIKTFDDAISAHILRNKLESEGIECFIHDEHIVTMNPLFNFAVGGVKLKVYEDDVPRALEIVQELEGTPLTNEKDQPIQCPNCASTDLYSNFKSMKGVKGVISTVVSFVLTVFPIYVNTVYRCKNCETEFKKS